MLTRCERHGRVYDSDKEGGCPLCLKEGPPGPLGHAKKEEAAPKPKLAMSNIILLAVLVAVLGFGGWWYFTQRNKPTPQQEIAAARAAARATPPESLRYSDPGDLTPVRKARTLVTFLDGFVRGNTRTLLAFPEGPIDTAATDKAEKKRAKNYASFAEHWHGALDRATREGHTFGYQPGVRLAQQMEQVSNGIAAALSVLRDLVPADHVVSRATRQADLRSATGYLATAHTVLSNLPK